jgi:hypothetical protein
LRNSRATTRLCFPDVSCQSSVFPNGRRATVYGVQRWPKYFQEDLSTVLSLLAMGKIEALGLLASGKASGKVVLVPRPEVEPQKEG